MGYRLNVKCNDTGLEFYGTKLYGYVNDETTLKSYKYLKRIGKFNGDEFFDYNCANEVTLSFFEFSIFIKCYYHDLITTDFFKIYKVQREKVKDDFKKLSKQSGDKTVWWD